ncbi:hypothetical protein [Flavobacterium sp.]|jgi:hypothetical protein|uniref:hypothetical protein n=1 Tax=Flavobacterium sp. TaxID=239 RepID=UPI0037C18C56
MSNAKLNTLEKLCYTSETARKAIELIYKLAITDNDLNNSAYFTFVDLFQVYLAETVIDLKTRLEIIDELQSKRLTKLIITAYERGLKAFGFIGHVHGSDDNLIEKQYRPSFDEVKIYQEEIIRRLKLITLSDTTELGIQAKESLYSRFSEQIHYGQSELILTTIEEIVFTKKILDDHLRNKFIEFTAKKAEVPNKIKIRINAILEQFQPESVEEELRLIVSESPWINEKVGDSYVNISSQKATDLANHYIKEQIDWLPHLIQLLKGEQRQTFYFAEAIAKNGFEKDLIINSLIDCLKSIPLEEQNSVFVNGLVIGINDNNFTRQVISKLIEHPETEVHGIRQIRFLKPITKEDIIFVRPLLEKKPEYLRNLEYIELTNFSKEDLIEVTSWIKDINYSFAIELLYEVLRKQDRWYELKDVVNEYLYVDKIFQIKSFINLSLHIEELIKKSIIENPEESKICFLIDLIIKGYDDFNNESILDHLTYFFLENYWEISWNYIGDFLANEEGRYHGLTMFLEKYRFENEKLFDWSQKNTEKYPAVAFQFMNIYVEESNGELSWEPVAKKMIDLFGKQNKILEHLSSKLSYYLIYHYSAESLYKKRKRFIEELIEHHFDEVKSFVQKEIEYLDNKIEQERKFGENYELGR